MTKLVDFITKHAIRGDCRCGKCADVPANPQQPKEHTINVHFFNVATTASESDLPQLAEELKKLIAEHKGFYGVVNPFDGNEHSYIELGGWVGDQSLALMLMGLGARLGLWQVQTPKSVFKSLISDELANNMAGMGYVTIQHNNTTKP